MPEVYTEWVSMVGLLFLAWPVWAADGAAKELADLERLAIGEEDPAILRKTKERLQKSAGDKLSWRPSHRICLAIGYLLTLGAQASKLA